MVERALELERAGCFSVVLECVPRAVAVRWRLHTHVSPYTRVLSLYIHVSPHARASLYTHVSLSMHVSLYRRVYGYTDESGIDTPAMWEYGGKKKKNVLHLPNTREKRESHGGLHCSHEQGVLHNRYTIGTQGEHKGYTPLV